MALALGPDGALWVGTVGRGLFRYHQGQWQVFNRQNGKLSDDNVSALAFGRDGALWVGTFGGGLARYHQGQCVGQGQSGTIFDTTSSATSRCSWSSAAPRSPCLVATRIRP